MTFVRVVIIAAIGVLGLAATAEGGGPVMNIGSFTIDGGGGQSSGGVFDLHGTIAQADASVALTGSSFELRGGFWGGGGFEPCPGDLDGDGSVATTDLLALLALWGACPPPCPPDLDGDGFVATTDLLALLAAWGSCS